MTALLSIATLTTFEQSPKIDAYLQPAFKDATFTAKVVQKDQDELAKINKDFGTSYRFASTNVFVKEPYMIRLDAKVEDTTATYLINGTKMAFKVAKLRMNQKQDVAKEPGRRQTLMDFGVLTPSLFTDLFDAKFVRNDRATGDIVFDLTYDTRFKDKTRHRVWIDPVKHYVTKREWYHRKGRMIATFIYEAPVSQDGVWWPSRLTVKNADDVVAGVTRYDDVKLNTGLSDDLFKI